MKAFLPAMFLLCFILPAESSFAQKVTPKTWEQAFREVDSLTVNGKPNEAYTLVNKLADRARAEGNSVMLIKSVMHRILFQSKLEEDYLYTIVNSLKADISKAKQPAKSVLQSLLAETYWQFYQANRYRFTQRTNLSSDPGDDIRTWSLEKITTETIQEYMASLSETQLLQGITTGELKELLAGDSSSRNLRPTLYDLLAHRAIDVLMNTQSGLASFQEGEININDTAWLSDYRTFSAMKISAADSTSFLAAAMTTFQNLLKYHAASGNKAALADADLKRLKFIWVERGAGACLSEKPPDAGRGSTGH